MMVADAVVRIKKMRAGAEMIPMIAGFAYPIAAGFSRNWQQYRRTHHHCGRDVRNLFKHGALPLFFALWIAADKNRLFKPGEELRDRTKVTLGADNVKRSYSKRRA
jgi:hypothetical protein